MRVEYSDGTSAPETPVDSGGGPDVVGRAKQALVREPPKGTHTLFGETDLPGRVVRAAGDLFLPGSVPDLARMAATLPVGGSVLTAPFKRTLAGGLAGAGAALAQGRDFAESLLEGGQQGVAQLTGEILPGLLGFGRAQQIGRPRLAAFAKAVADREKTIEADKAAYRAARDARPSAVEAAKTEHAAAMRDYAQTGAAIIADDVKQQVPALRQFPSTERGLYGMIYGDGPLRVSRAFDAALGRIVPQARDIRIRIPLEDAHRLDVDVLGLNFARAVDASGVIQETRQLAEVSVADAIRGVTGMFLKDRGLYRRTVNTIMDGLAAVDLGDAYKAARGEYRAAQALFEFGDRARMFDKNKRFDPAATRAGQTVTKTIDSLRKRDQGHGTEGSIAAVVDRPEPISRSVPAPPRPALPPEVPPPRGIKSVERPRLGFYSHLPGVPGGVYLHGRPKAPQTIVTEAPMTSAERWALRLLPAFMGQEAATVAQE